MRGARGTRTPSTGAGPQAAVYSARETTVESWSLYFLVTGRILGGGVVDMVPVG